MTRVKMGWAALAMVTLAGCASTSQPQTAAEMFDCSALNQAVASAEGGFAGIKGRFEDNRLTRTWETDVQAFHESCLITSSQRPDHYSCFGRMDSDDPRGALTVGGEALGQCLGADWSSTREEGSDRLIFSKAGTDTTVSLETFLNDRGRRMASLDVWQHPDDLRLESTGR
ncbi:MULTISPECIES: hypothetical protein [unclassified Halomonas]|uniref:hypothetical protein n=1 Tax=unclassified Halomonas TaxID=2609666 RepID=UPI001C979F95|nr:MULTISPECIES: hypothetical protein [unclassified Halomonas]MBY5926336.1 hypothetical protein [Halomonas sp. DP4Y7-2]MBY6030138.1 hypothetical protein [Halomonas sp. DP8Y7-1]MBY6233378.1 hypothetical protein [Halomonas sp. DP4Y7-1]MEE3215848.1 hypothetical protein [Pseudomonadota bacterium]